ncbi:hypothetical protein H633G_08962 [Metarhizium anisopliae BRIP 53284]|nr:hypothetical protein H633G_08962 [Metarhizium anisopliae BRIP 53284]
MNVTAADCLFIVDIGRLFRQVLGCMSQAHHRSPGQCIALASAFDVFEHILYRSFVRAQPWEIRLNSCAQPRRDRVRGYELLAYHVNTNTVV